MPTHSQGPLSGPVDVAVIGAGAWGTALALQAHRAGASCALWVRAPAAAAELAATRHARRLPAHPLPAPILVTADSAIPARLRLLAVPAQHVRAVARTLPADAPMVVCAKGIERQSGMLLLDVLAELHPGLPGLVLSGPNFAHEIAAGLPAATVLAGTDATLRATIADRLATAEFRIYGNEDPIGVQVGGAAKNVMAIAAGAVTGAGLGENARAALITRGLAELARLATALGGRAETIAGLSGLGDLVLTCTGPASRNFSLGLALGRGAPPETAAASVDGVTEGSATAPALRAIADTHGLDLPICRAVADLLDQRLDLPGAITALLSRPRRDE